MTELSIFRTSFIWVETVPAILAGKTAGQPYSFLGQYGDYAKAFEECRAGQLAAGSLKLPWDSPRGNRYWQYYFERHAGDVTGEQAWKKIAPFQLDLPCKVTSKDPEVIFAFEAFYAPHGISVIARCTYRGAPKSPLDAAKLALAARYDYRFEIDGSSGLSLDRAADNALALARKRGFGDKAEGIPGDNQPFSITTFLVGKDVAPLTQGSDEHFLLEAVTGWARSLKKDDLAKLPLADARLAISSMDDQNLMYARKRGRAIWLPRSFAENPNTATLACYHRNITQASRQTLSLGEFVSWFAAERGRQAAVPATVAERARRAAQLLDLSSKGKEPTGKKTTYRSASVVEQVKSAEWANAIKLVMG